MMKVSPTHRDLVWWAWDNLNRGCPADMTCEKKQHHKCHFKNVLKEFSQPEVSFVLTTKTCAEIGRAQHCTDESVRVAADVRKLQQNSWVQESVGSIRVAKPWPVATAITMVIQAACSHFSCYMLLAGEIPPVPQRWKTCRLTLRFGCKRKCI